MKKNLLLLVLMLLPLAAIADAVEINGLYYNLDSTAKTAEVTSNPNKYTGDIVIPEAVTYDGTEYSVTSIGEGVFWQCNDLTSVTIGNSVVTIGDSAFESCSGLTSVTIGNGVTYVGRWAFNSCIGLTSVVIGNSVTYIGNYAFGACRSLTSITIPNSVTSIEDGAFHNCICLTSVTIGNSVISIGDFAFQGCSGLTSVTIPNSVTSINNFAFNDCIGLTSVTIGNSVTSIGNGAFQNCSNLSSVTIGSGVLTIGRVAFANCQKLEDVYCYAENVPSTNRTAFDNSNIDNSTLHVPEASISAYQAAEPWKNFKNIVALDGSTPGPQKCATPTISYINGKLTFDCETDGVEFVSEITSSDFTKHYGSEVSLTCTYLVSVYATKDGYEDSEVATKEISIEGSGLKGDVNGDGEVGIGDIISITNIMAE